MFCQIRTRPTSPVALNPVGYTLVAASTTKAVPISDVADKPVTGISINKSTVTPLSTPVACSPVGETVAGATTLKPVPNSDVPSTPVG